MGIRLGSVVAIVIVLVVVACAKSGSSTGPQPDLDNMRMYEPLAMRTEAKLPDHAVILGTDAKGGSTVLRIPTTSSTSAVDAATARAQVRVKLTTAPNADGDVHVGIFEERVGANSEQWRASVWVAATVAAHTLGKDLTDFTFGASAADALDGPSASGLIAGGFLATMTGAKIDAAVTLIGVIHPDGTIGPVDGLAEKLQTAVAAGKKKIGYPAGMRRVRAATGAEIDVVELAKTGGAAAIEVGTVHEAYKLLTGVTLPATIPVAVAGMTVEPDRAAAIAEKYDVWQAKLAVRASALAELQQAKDVPATLTEVAGLAKQSAERAAALRAKGATAAAFASMVAAWGYAAAATDSYAILTKVRAGDVAGALAAVENFEQVVETQQSLETVATMRPNTIGGHVLMMGAYQSALRGAIFAVIAQARIEAAQEHLRTLAGVPKASLAAADTAADLIAAVLPAKLLTARSVIESAIAVQRLEFETGKSINYMCSVPNVIRLATSYRSASTAGMSYLDSLRTKPAGPGAATADPDYLAAYSLAHLDDVASSIKTQFGEKSLAWNLLLLAGAERAYADAAQLTAKHYSFADGIRHEGALASLLANAELAARASARAAEVATGAIPVQAKFAYQLATAQRENGDKLDALTSYWAATAYSQAAVMLARN